MNLDNFSYHMPTKIVYRQNSLEDIDNYINHRRTLLITSKGFVERGLIDKIITYTDSIVEVIANVKSHPEFVDIKNIYSQAHQKQFELIVAIGGGSVIDTAKFISIHNKTKDYQFVEGLAKGKMPKKDYTIIPVISIPTTAGTGSEITPYSTIWDMEEKKKYSLNIPELFPEIAIYDPSLTLTVPKDITIQTGLDALSHSLESIWNKNATPVTLSYAVKSAKLIINNLADLSNDLNNLSLRSNMMMACMYAGMAISNTQTAIAHAMSYHVTSHKGIPHGIACSFTLPMLIDSIAGKYEFIDNALIEIFNEPSSKKIRKLFKRLGVKVDMASYNMFEEDISRMLLTLDNNRSKNSMIKIKNLSFNF